jgi:hypothetical protein
MYPAILVDGHDFPMKDPMPKSMPWSWGGLMGLMVTLSACGGGGGGGGNAIAAGGDQLLIQPIRVCDDTGIVCAQMNFFEAITDKLWAQAGIGVTFLPPNQLNNSTFLSIAPGSGSNSEFSQLAFSGGAGAFGRHPSSSRTTGPINMWFVDVIEAGSGLVQYGSAWIGLNGVLISDDIYIFNGGVGRLDVIAHELGHNLGLEHDTLGAGGANNLMSDGSRRAIPNSIDDIFPDGARLGQLTGDQIQRVRSSGFLMSQATVVGLTAPGPDEVPVAAADATGEGGGRWGRRGSQESQDGSAFIRVLVDGGRG